MTISSSFTDFPLRHSQLCLLKFMSRPTQQYKEQRSRILKWWTEIWRKTVLFQQCMIVSVTKPKLWLMCILSETKKMHLEHEQNVRAALGFTVSRSGELRGCSQMKELAYFSLSHVSTIHLPKLFHSPNFLSPHLSCTALHCYQRESET